MPARLVGAVLARDLTVGGERWSKGRRLTAADLAAIGDAEPGDPVSVLLPDPGEIHEDDAAVRLATAVGGPGLRMRGPAESRVDLIAEGLTNREIGGRLAMSESTASVHVSRILSKMGVISRVEAAGLAIRTGLDTPPDTARPG